MPLNNRPVSSLPPIGGGRVGVGSGVGDVGVGPASRGAKYCNRSCDIQRYKMAAKINAARSSTNLRNVARPDFATAYFFNQATIATTMPITLKIDIMPAGMNAPVRMNFEPK